ncbi:imelysin family protein [Granulosicoccus sp. 3-233]|uniref:imelysin family protein n=1 Tax=Granulosicoccus sp. 3-233 TaxID=3417969 RepID=UPI003D332322
MSSALLVACSDGDGGPATDLVGDDVRRLVLSDIGNNIIMPALRDFSLKADALNQAVIEHAQSPDDAVLRIDAQAAWRDAMLSWQYLEPLQVGPAGASTGLDGTRGGADLRADIYSYPLLSTCTIEELARNDLTVNDGSAVNTTGLGALEFLLYNEEADPCSLGTAATVSQRASYAASAAVAIRDAANDLQQRWEPEGGDFLGQWNTAGDGSEFYILPQNALNALSVALFYVDKQTKDLKIASPTGIGASGLEECTTISCPERLESSLSGLSGDNIRANVQVFLGSFQGVDGGRGLNDLLSGIGREDLATEITDELLAVIAHLDAMDTGFDESVAAIPSAEACINGTANPNEDSPAACALHGYLKTAMDTFRGSIVAALSLATPASTAGDND